MRKKTWCMVGACLLCAAVLLVGSLAAGRLWLHLENHPVPLSAASVKTEAPQPIFLLDAGHGGEDGGASGVDGVTEKQLNLQVTSALYEISTLFGYPAQMTRTDDRLLYDMYHDLPSGMYTGHKKTYDLRSRLRLAKESGCTVFCSVHMNKFPQTQYRGLQVYYSPNHPDSLTYAGFLQNRVRALLQPDNTREIKRATSSIYLLHRIQSPAVLVECGFLSNPEECALLETESYRLQLAAVLFTSLAECYEDHTES